MAAQDGIDFDQCRTRAKDLLKLARAGDPQALDLIRQHHPEAPTLLASGRIQLADTQLVLAREQGYPSWPRLKEDMLARTAVSALDRGDLPGLTAMLDRAPALISYRCRRGEWYEAGYFQGATLLHHVAGNPIRHPIPSNVVDIARILLDRGADPNAKTQAGWTTIGLILTSKQASEAGVAPPLIDLLRAAGAKDRLSDEEMLSLPLLNAAPATAEALVQRGAKMDLRHAAGLGKIEELRAMLAGHDDQSLREEALLFAAIRGQTEAARILADAGAKGDVLLGPGGRTPRTALHEAALRGHREIVEIILDHGADARVIEPQWGGTPAGWARHDGRFEIAELLEHRSSTQRGRA